MCKANEIQLQYVSFVIWQNCFYKHHKNILSGYELHVTCHSGNLAFYNLIVDQKFGTVAILFLVAVISKPRCSKIENFIYYQYSQVFWYMSTKVSCLVFIVFWYARKVHPQLTTTDIEENDNYDFFLIIGGVGEREQGESTSQHMAVQS